MIVEWRATIKMNREGWAYSSVSKENLFCKHEGQCSNPHHACEKAKQKAGHEEVHVEFKMSTISKLAKKLGHAN